MVLVTIVITRDASSSAAMKYVPGGMWAMNLPPSLARERVVSRRVPTGWPWLARV